MEIRHHRSYHNPITGRSNTVEVEEHVLSDSELQAVRTTKAMQVVSYIVGIIETLLVLRLVLGLFGASQVGFAAFIYNITAPFVAPFRGIFANPASGEAFLDSAAILAMIVVGLIGWGINALIDTTRKPVETDL